MKSAMTCLLLPLLLTLVCGAAAEAGTARNAEEAISAAVDIFVAHLRANFDDIHDVSMRHHLYDPSLGGTIALRLVWKDGRMTRAEVLENETGSTAEAADMIEAIRRWHIEGLDDVEFSIPLRIKMVGSDDPAFHQRAILTGTVRDEVGNPVHGAVVSLCPAGGEGDPVTKATANREGVFIRSLIEPGTWSLRCECRGYRPRTIEPITLTAGEHRKLQLVLEPVPDTSRRKDIS
jgi:hypothetical protein